MWFHSLPIDVFDFIYTIFMDRCKDGEINLEGLESSWPDAASTINSDKSLVLSMCDIIYQWVNTCILVGRSDELPS